MQLFFNKIIITPKQFQVFPSFKIHLSVCSICVTDSLTDYRCLTYSQFQSTAYRICNLPLSCIGLVTYHFLDCDGVTEVYGELAYVYKGVLVGKLSVQGESLHQGVLHKVDEGEGAGGGELTVLDVGHVHLLEERPRKIWCLQNRMTVSNTLV